MNLTAPVSSLSVDIRPLNKLDRKKQHLIIMYAPIKTKYILLTILLHFICPNKMSMVSYYYYITF